MGGVTQSKLAFISTTIKKKNEDLNKSKLSETEKEIKVIHCYFFFQNRECTYAAIQESFGYWNWKIAEACPYRNFQPKIMLYSF